MEDDQRLEADYPWIQTPLIVSAPMRLIALADMAVEVSKAGGIGFIGAGTDVSNLKDLLENALVLLKNTNLPTSPTLPIGVGFINWGADMSTTIPIIKQYKPCAVWLFAPSSMLSLFEWAERVREASPDTKIWVQIGSVQEALKVMTIGVNPDVLVVQGTDAGGHGLVQGAGITSLVPEVIDTIASVTAYTSLASRSLFSETKEVNFPIFLAAGGIVEARGTASALCLGASGVVLGTRFLASHEANISAGYKNEILRAKDGGQSTVRSKVYDNLRGTTGWAETHNARGVINKSYQDALSGMSDEENKKLYKVEEAKGDAGWGEQGRMTTYAGAGVGLVKEVKSCGEIVREIREGAKAVLGRVATLGLGEKRKL